MEMKIDSGTLLPRLRRRSGILIASTLLVGSAVVVTGTGHAGAASGEGFNREGNILISDQFNNRVIEVDPHTHRVVWSWGKGPNDISAASILGVNDTQRVGELTLMAGTGVPMATPPLEPNCPAGCVDNRVILVDEDGHIVWQYGQFGQTGTDDNFLNVPVQATWLPNGHVLITDQSNERVIEVNHNKHIVWQYGAGPGLGTLNNPNSAELLENGHILIADENNNRVIEVNRDHDIVWQYPQVPDPSLLSGAAFASRLENGNTLITDSNNDRVIEVTSGGSATVVWQGNNLMALPTRAVRLENGNTLISDQFDNIVIEINHHGKVVFTQGKLGIVGDGFNRLNAPYDAKVIGDYTGLTPPFNDDEDDDR
jgi:hypothetical protein